ncbi:hypothetical protein AB1Y20_009964 [Prymnesium parvum]|uniref:Mediator of RNA polymerase II transcription subunit 10 n=1 Tax=Prymnesium parvum TaxID=97485 RepID=A0AB34K6K5_PRYPA|mmetsp:Transcript_8860/g.18463  ORF Transcript_8860/g.18463 Transcript_8860/m.18463 type:complete len:136 (-) Transcript_8860:133-540(-)
MSELQDAIANAIEDARQLDIMALSEKTSNPTFLDGINAFITRLERVKTVSQSSDLEVPVEFIHRHVDEARSPDDFKEDILSRVKATANQTRGKIAALQHLKESVRQFSKQHGLMDEPGSSDDQSPRGAKRARVDQ